MAKSDTLPSLHIPGKPPSPSKIIEPTELPLAQRRKLRKSRRNTIAEHQTIDGHPYSLSTGKGPLEYFLDKPLPPLPHEREQAEVTQDAQQHIAFACDPELSQLPHSHAGQISHARRGSELIHAGVTEQKAASSPLANVIRTVSRVVTFKRRAAKPDARPVNWPSTYVDKGTQTLEADFSSTSHKRLNSGGSDISALRQYHASVKAGHDPAHPRRLFRPAAVNMRSLKSFLNDTSPSNPGTPTPMERFSSNSGISPRTPPSRLHVETPLESPRGGLGYVEPQVIPTAHNTPFGHPSAQASLNTVGTYESQYSVRPGPAPDELKIPGASSSNKPLPLPPSSTASSSVSIPTTTGARDESSFTYRPPIMSLPSAQTETGILMDSGVRPPTPMPADFHPSTLPASPPKSAPPLTPPRTSNRPPYNLPKGRQAELRKSSPGRHSPLRQLTSVNDPQPPGQPPVPVEPVQDLRRTSPGIHDHHARAARQGLPPDAFIPPPTPPPDDYVFRRPIFDYFSSPEGEAARRKHEDVPHVPDHYQNSPLCPLHPKHRGGQGDFCPIHGPLKRTSDGSFEERQTTRRSVSQANSRSRSSESHRSGDSASDEVILTPPRSPGESMPRTRNHARDDPKCPRYSEAGHCVIHGRSNAFDARRGSRNGSDVGMDGFDGWRSPSWSVKLEVQRIENEERGRSKSRSWRDGSPR